MHTVVLLLAIYILHIAAFNVRPIKSKHTCIPKPFQCMAVMMVSCLQAEVSTALSLTWNKSVLPGKHYSSDPHEVSAVLAQHLTMPG